MAILESTREIKTYHRVVSTLSALSTLGAHTLQKFEAFISGANGMVRNLFLTHNGRLLSDELTFLQW